MWRSTLTSAGLALGLASSVAVAQDAAREKPAPIAVRDAERAYQGAKRKADEEYATRLKAIQQEHAQKVNAAHKAYDRAIDDAIRNATRGGDGELAGQLARLKQAAAEQALLDAGDGAGAAAGRDYLSDMEHDDVVVFANWFGKAGTINGPHKISIGGKYSPKGISLVPPLNGFSSVKFQLGGRYKSFAAHVAINDTAERSTIPLVFEVLADGKSVWRSAPVQASKAPQECRVDVRGANVLELRVNCPGSNVDAHAVWAEPRVLR